MNSDESLKRLLQANAHALEAPPGEWEQILATIRRPRSKNRTRYWAVTAALAASIALSIGLYRVKRFDFEAAYDFVALTFGPTDGPESESADAEWDLLSEETPESLSKVGTNVQNRA